MVEMRRNVGDSHVLAVTVCWKGTQNRYLSLYCLDSVTFTKHISLETNLSSVPVFPMLHIALQLKMFPESTSRVFDFSKTRLVS